MDEVMNVGLQEELISDLTTELSKEPTFDAELLKAKVVSAIKEVARARKYPKYYARNYVSEDLYDYYTNIRNIALYDYNLAGAEGQTSASENGVSRNYVDRKSLFAGIIPIAMF